MSEISFGIRSARFLVFLVFFYFFFERKTILENKLFILFENVLIFIKKEYSKAKKVFKFKNYMLPRVLSRQN